jgi:hypothetical protein
MQPQAEIPGQPVAPPPQAALTPPSQVTMGSLIGRTFSVWKLNLVRFAGVTLAVQIPSLLLGWAVGSPLAAASPNPFARPSPEVAEWLFGPGWWAVSIAGGLLSLVHMGALTAGAIQHLAGRRASVGEMLASGLRRLVPILLAGVLAILAMYAGLILLVVPGIIFGLMFSLAVPAVMAESLGPVKALGRSRALTRGRRWALLGAFFVTYLVVAGLGFAVVGVSFATPALGRVLGVAVNAIFGSLLYLVPAVAYHDLRVAREGVATAELARVFE